MKNINLIIGVAIVSLVLVLTTGCELVTLNNQPIDQWFKGVMAQLNAHQKAQLEQQSPQTLEKLKNNDAVPAAPQQSSTPSPVTSPQMQPLNVDDIKALAAAGLKDEVINDEIQKSNSRFSPQDIAAAQQANPPVGQNVIECMKQNPS